MCKIFYFKYFILVFRYIKMFNGKKDAKKAWNSCISKVVLIQSFLVSVGRAILKLHNCSVLLEYRQNSAKH